MLGTVPEFIRGDKGDLNNSKPFQRFCSICRVTERTRFYDFLLEHH